MSIISQIHILPQLQMMLVLLKLIGEHGQGKKMGENYKY
jgi:hypothetical protein